MDGPSITRRQAREIDALAIDRYGISGMVLMENAGRGVVDLLLQWDPALVGDNGDAVGILCGKGNNAGDGFVIARHLGIRDARPRVLLLSSPADLRGDARQNYDILCHSNVPIIDLSASDDLASDLNRQTGDAGWLVDAMLGTGACGEPREPFLTAISWMNRQEARRLAIDVPSGLDCDTGQAASVTVRADRTCTFVAAKAGFAVPTAGEYVGELHVVSIGIPPQWIAQAIEDSRQ